MVGMASHLQAIFFSFLSINLPMTRLKKLWKISPMMLSWYCQNIIEKHWCTELHASTAVGFLKMSFRKRRSKLCQRIMYMELTGLHILMDLEVKPLPLLQCKFIIPSQSIYWQQLQNMLSGNSQILTYGSKRRTYMMR